MNSVILCEGFDDALLLGYFLHKTSDEPKWIYNSKARLSENFSLPKVNSQTEKIEIYTRKENKTAIWSVGGKDKFKHAIEHVLSLSKDFPKERFQNIIIVSDRDNDDVDAVVNKYRDVFKSYEIECELVNNITNKAKFSKGDIDYNINIIPIIVPFNQKGAIETVLINSLKESDGQDELVVESAEKYISEIVENTKITRYLTTGRQQLKGKFSAVISVTNPDRSTRTMDNILLTHEWQEKPEIIRHFGIISKVLND